MPRSAFWLAQGTMERFFLSSNFVCFRALGLWQHMGLSAQLDVAKTSLCKGKDSIVLAKKQVKYCARA